MLLKVSYQHVNRLVREGKLRTKGEVPAFAPRCVLLADVYALRAEPERTRRRKRLWQAEGVWPIEAIGSPAAK